MWFILDYDILDKLRTYDVHYTGYTGNYAWYTG